MARDAFDDPRPGDMTSVHKDQFPHVAERDPQTGQIRMRPQIDDRWEPVPGRPGWYRVKGTQ